jgi:hypothetical protein
LSTKGAPSLKGDAWKVVKAMVEDELE